MADTSYFRLQFIVFALVSASFTNIYITQPVLPVLQDEFVADMVLVSFSVSAVILGIAISNLPFDDRSKRKTFRIPHSNDVFDSFLGIPTDYPSWIALAHEISSSKYESLPRSENFLKTSQ